MGRHHYALVMRRMKNRKILPFQMFLLFILRFPQENPSQTDYHQQAT